MPKIANFLGSDTEYENHAFVNHILIQSQINKASMVLTKYENTVVLLMNNMSNFHDDHAKTLYAILDNLSQALRINNEVLNVQISTRFVPFIYKYPCQDGIIARIFEISSHINNLFFILNEFGKTSPELLDHLNLIFKKFEITLVELQRMIQQTTLLKCRDDAILKSVLYSDDEEDEEDEYNDEE